MCIPLEERSLNELPRFTPSGTSYQRVTCREMSTKKVKNVPKGLSTNEARKYSYLRMKYLIE